MIVSFILRCVTPAGEISIINLNIPEHHTSHYLQTAGQSNNRVVQWGSDTRTGYSIVTHGRVTQH